MKLVSMGEVGEKIATLEEQLKRAKAEAAKRKEQCERAAGKAVLAEAETNPDFAAQLQTILETRLTGKRDRALFGLEARAEDGKREDAPEADQGEAPQSGFSG